VLESIFQSVFLETYDISEINMIVVPTIVIIGTMFVTIPIREYVYKQIKVIIGAATTKRHRSVSTKCFSISEGEFRVSNVGSNVSSPVHSEHGSDFESL